MQAMLTKKGLSQHCVYNALTHTQLASDMLPKATCLQQYEHTLRLLNSFHSHELVRLVSTI